MIEAMMRLDRWFLEVPMRIIYLPMLYVTCFVVIRISEELIKKGAELVRKTIKAVLWIIVTVYGVKQAMKFLKSAEYEEIKTKIKGFMD